MSTENAAPPRIVVGFWRRFFSDLLDSIVLGAFGYAIGYPLRYTFSAMGLHALWVGLACSFLYFGILHTRITNGQTLGKRMLGIQVVKRDGTFLSVGASLLRYVAVSFVFYNGLYGSLVSLLPTKASMAIGAVFLLVVIWVFFASFLLIPLHPLKRGLHDLVAGSVVVYQGTYDAVTLDRMENPAKAKRAMWILSAVTVAVASLFVVGLFTTKSSALDELSNIVATLRRDYDVRGVKEVRFNRGEPILAVQVFLPLTQFDDKVTRERVRRDLDEKVRANVSNLEHYQKVQIVLLSGFNIGIARLNIADAGGAK